MTDFFEERRLYPRSARALTLQLHHPQDHFFLGRGVGNVRTCDLGAGGAAFHVFEPIPFRTDDEVAVRILVPTDGSEDDGLPASILGPAVSGRGIVQRIDRVYVHGIAGIRVAIRFAGPLAVDSPDGLTVTTAIR